MLQTFKHSPLTYWLSILALSVMLVGCGFHLRQASPIAFKTIHLTGPKLFVDQLKKSLADQGVNLVNSAEDAELQLELFKPESEKRILSLSGAGLVREYEVYYRMQFRTKISGEPSWSLPLMIESRRDFTYNDANLLAKQAEEKMLNESMQSDMLNGIMRHLAALKKVP